MRTRSAVPFLLLLAGCGSGESLLGSATSSTRRVAYVADLGTDEQFRLYVTRFDGQTGEVSGPIGPNGDVLDYAWSPDRRLIAFVADAFADDLEQLFVVDTNGGGERFDLTAGLTPFGSLTQFAWSPDGSRIAFLGEATVLGVPDLVTIRPDGTGMVRLNPDFAPPLQQVVRFAWSPDSTRVAYAANQDQLNVLELYVAPADGSSPAVQVSGTMTAGGSLPNEEDTFAWSPDSTRLLYRADQDVDELVELYVSSADGTTNVRVSGPVVQDVREPRWSPNGARIAYLAEQDAPGRVDLYSVLPDGTDNVRVSADFVTGGNVETYAWSPRSDLLAYRADQELDTRFLLCTAPATGTGATVVSGELFDVGVVSFAWAPDGSRVAYLARQDSFQFAELYTVLSDGSQNLKVSAEFPVFGTVDDYVWNPDSRTIAYLANVDNPNVREVHVTGALGGSRRVSGPSQSGIRTCTWAAEGDVVFYLGPQSTFGIDELYRASPDGDQAKTSGVLAPGGNVLSYEAPGRPQETAGS